ncbi:hypothetical protein [Hymenobacter lapidarius]|nr:hypothetical protein [Hymenobacter lapidarius]
MPDLKPHEPMPTRRRATRTEPRLGQRLLFLSVLFGVLLSFPLLGVFDHETRVGGVPGLYLYILLIWVLLVGITGFLVRKSSGD